MRELKKVFIILILASLALGVALQPISVWADGSPIFATKWDGISFPTGIAVDNAGDVYVADSGGFVIKKFDGNGTLLTQLGAPGSGDGQFNTLTGVAVDSVGNVYATDAGAITSFNPRVQKFDNSGAFDIKWGSFGTGNGQFVSPSGLAVDSVGNVYVADTNNKRIQKFDSSGGYLTKWATAGNPYGVAIDNNSGHVYVTNAPSPLVQKFSLSGALITSWGSLGTDAGQFNATLYGVTVDQTGNVYVADRGNHRIQMFDENGTFIQMWGFGVNTGAAEFEVCTAATTPCQPGIPGTGDGQFNSPAGVAVDSSGNIYVVEESNNRVQKFGQTLLLITKSVNDDQPDLGQRITYTITVENSGATTLTNAVISDTIPNGLTLAGPITLEGSGGVIGSPPTLASGLTIGVGQRITVTFPVTVSSMLSPNTVITNTAAVTSDQVVTPQTDSTTIIVNAVKLTLIKTIPNPLDLDNIIANPGERITYTIRVNNSGVTAATSAVISDTLPAGLTFIGPVALEGTSGTIDTPPTLASGLTITAGTSITLTFPVTVNPGQDDGTIIINTAAVTSAEVSTPQIGAFPIIVFDTISPTFPIVDLLTLSPLITPTLDVILDTAQPVFEWHSALDNSQVISYVLTLSSTLESINLLDVTTTQTSFTPPQSLAAGDYTWTIQAQDAAGNKSEPIPPQSFTIRVNDSPLAMFLAACTDLTCDFDASAASDPDGSIVSYSWDFGDNNTGSGVTTNHTFDAAGSYNVTLTVMDDDGATASETQSVIVTQPVLMHVGDLDGTSLSNGKNWQAQAIIAIHDNNHQAVADATVSGTWSGDGSGSSSCTTNADGACAVTSGDIPKKGSSATFTVNSVDHASFTYTPADNHDPDGDSSGDAIQMNKDGTTGNPGAPTNQPPTASFTYICPDLTCNFDASGSTDPDGSLVSYAWDFGDENSGNGVTPSHTYAAPGSYNIVLSVTDAGGATASETQTVTISDGSGGLTLTASGYKVKGVQQVDLAWNGTSTNVDIYRDGILIGTTSGTTYTDNIGNKGSGSYTYLVCETGSSTCSNEAVVTF